MSNGGRHYAADEIVAPALIALKALYDELRGADAARGGHTARDLLAYAALPPVETLPGLEDLAIVEVLADGRYRYLAMGAGYRRTAALTPGPDGVTAETRPVVRQHFDLACRQRAPFHVSVTRWDGPKILQFDRLILPLDDGQDGAGRSDPNETTAGGAITHLLVGEVFLRFARG